jgi:hypothetical protein
VVALEIKPTTTANVRVAAVIFIAFAIAMTLVFLLTSGGRVLFASYSTLYTYVPDAAGLAGAAEVRLSGIPIGTVEKIEISDLVDPQRVVRVQMRVGTQYLRNIPADSQTIITEDNIAGGQFISIDEGKSPIPVHADGILASEPVTDAADRADLIRNLQDKFQQVNDLLTQMSSPNTVIGRLVNGSQEYDGLVAHIGAFERSLHTLEAPGNPVGTALFSDALYNDLRRYVTKVDDTLSSIQRGEGQSGRLFASDQQYADFVRELHDLRTALAEANAGKGKFGPLLHDDASYRAIERTLAQTDAMIAALNAGDGEMGKLLTSAQLYESLSGSLQSMKNLLADFRKHPEKYLRYKLD